MRVRMVRMVGPGRGTFRWWHVSGSEVQLKGSRDDNQAVRHAMHEVGHGMLELAPAWARSTEPASPELDEALVDGSVHVVVHPI